MKTRAGTLPPRANKFRCILEGTCYILEFDVSILELEFIYSSFIIWLIAEEELRALHEAAMNMEIRPLSRSSVT